MQDLTEQEQNLVKDVLKFMGQDDDLNAQFAKACGFDNAEDFDLVADSVFKKLGNGRLIVENS